MAPVEEGIIKTKWVDVIGANVNLAGAEIDMIEMDRREYRLKMVLDQVREEYDYIFIDCPPSLGLLTLNSLCAADSFLVPLQCEYYALEGLTQLMTTVRAVQRGLNENIRMEGVLLTMFDGRTNLSIQVVEEVKRHFGKKVFATVVPRNVRLSEAAEPRRTDYRVRSLLAAVRKRTWHWHRNFSEEMKRERGETYGK